MRCERKGRVEDDMRSGLSDVKDGIAVDWDKEDSRRSTFDISSRSSAITPPSVRCLMDQQVEIPGTHPQA